LQEHLARHRQQQGEMRKTVKAAIKKVDDPKSSYTQKEMQAFRAFNIDPSQQAALKRNIIQTGWINPTERGSRAVVCLHVRRTTLENWVQKARENLDNFAREPGKFTRDILEIYTGATNDEIRAGSSIGDIVEITKDIAYQPPILEQSFLTGIKSEDKALIFNLRVAFNNLNILLRMDRLFDKYEEGWIPMDLMPGTRLRGAIDQAIKEVEQ
jgi:hypothetical protein